MPSSKRRILTVACVVVSLAFLPGCLTLLMWEGHERREHEPVELVTRSDDDPGRAETTQSHFWPTFGKALATPVTLAIDVTCFAGYLWLLDKTDDDDC